MAQGEYISPKTTIRGAGPVGDDTNHEGRPYADRPLSHHAFLVREIFFREAPPTLKIAGDAYAVLTSDMYGTTPDSASPEDTVGIAVMKNAGESAGNVRSILVYPGNMPQTGSEHCLMADRMKQPESLNAEAILNAAEKFEKSENKRRAVIPVSVGKIDGISYSLVYAVSFHTEDYHGPNTKPKTGRLIILEESRPSGYSEPKRILIVDSAQKIGDGRITSDACKRAIGFWNVRPGVTDITTVSRTSERPPPMS